MGRACLRRSSLPAYDQGSLHAPISLRWAEPVDPSATMMCNIRAARKWGGG